MRDKLQYWDRTRDAPPDKLKGHEYVTIADDCPPKVTRRVRAAIVKHKRVFNEKLGRLPLPVKGGVVKVQLKESGNRSVAQVPNGGMAPSGKSSNVGLTTSWQSGNTNFHHTASGDRGSIL